MPTAPSSYTQPDLYRFAEALLTYATTLAFDLHLRASPKYAQRPDLLRTHPILSRLLTLKQSLHTLEELDFAASDDDSGLSSSDFDGEGEDEDEDEEFDWMADAQDLWAGNNTLKRKGAGLEQDELEELLREAEGLMDTDVDLAPRANGKGKEKEKPKRKTKAAGGEPEPPKKKRKAADAGAKTARPVPVFDLVEPELDFGLSSKGKSKGKSKAHTSVDAAENVYGEASALDAADAADKQARKKSLRFHVARIESTAARRAGARAHTVGGDDDIPYRERKREREARLAKEVAKAREGLGADLDDADPELEMEGGGEAPGRKGKKRSRDEEDEGSGGEEDGYYELVKRKSKENKERKKEEYETAAAAARYVFPRIVDVCRKLIPPRDQDRRRGERGWAAVTHACDPQEQGPDPETLQVRAQPARQEAGEIREGEEEGRLAACGVQGRRRREQVWRREDRHLADDQECPAVMRLFRHGLPSVLRCVVVLGERCVYMEQRQAPANTRCGFSVVHRKYSSY